MAQPSSRRILATVAAVASLTIAASVAAPAVAGASTRKHRATSHGAMVKLEKSSKYGKILVDSSGRTLYYLTSDSASSPTCTTGSCTGLWPPLMTKGKPRAGKGISKKLLGTTKRGSKLQVTYHGHRLYLYAGDSGVGQVNGEGIKSFGGTWYVLTGKGKPVKASLTSSKSGSGTGYGSSGSSGSSGGW
jgi:predicted lipoprotein with Yx(FWY)xxD motif